MALRNTASFLGLCIAFVSFGWVSAVAAQAPASASGEWVVPTDCMNMPVTRGITLSPTY